MTAVYGPPLSVELRDLHKHPPNKADTIELLGDLAAAAEEMEAEVDSLRTAAHMLHEQAHNGPWRSCGDEPCVSMTAERAAGTAPWNAS